MSLDLDAYCGRIGYAGPRVPTLPVLQQVHALHTERIAFENLSQLAREPVALDVAALEHKLVRKRRGGYCFEQNLLLQQALEGFGFDVRALAARVRWNRPAGPPGARTHMLLEVGLDGAPWIADVGFGGLTLTAPLALVPGLEQATPHEPFRVMAAADGAYALEARVGRHWLALYTFDRQPQVQADHELTSWYLCHHPQSPFVTGLMAARPGSDGSRHSLANNRYALRRPDGTSDKRVLADVDELIGVLDTAFGLDAAQVPGLAERLAALVG